MKTITCIHRLWDTARGFYGFITLNALLGMAGVCLSLLFVWLTKQLVDGATLHPAQPLAPYIAGMIACMSGQLLFGVLNSRIGVRNQVLLTNRLRHRLFVRVMESRWQGRELLHTGDMLNRLETDVHTVVGTLCGTFPSITVTLMQLAAAFGFLLMLEARLAWTLLFIMPVALLLSKSYMRRMRALTRDIRRTDSQVQSHLQEHLQHRTLIRSMEHSDRSTRMLDNLQGTWTSQVMRRTRFSLFSRTVVQAGFSAGYVTAFLWGIFGLQDGTVTFGMLTAFLQLVVQVQRPVVDLSRQIPGLVHTLTSIERLAELIDLPQEEQGSPVKLEGAPGIRLSHVSFAYPDGKRQVLTDFSHDFAPRSLTAVVGETGVGKSTLIRLMLALLRPDEGEVVLYDGARQIMVSPCTRCNLVYVPQGNTLMSGTIRDNLLLGNPHATEAEMGEALHTAVADFVYDLPQGLDSLCGEGGTGLSEGQAQRIAIARGLLRRGGVLLLDEPTSALDAQTEQTLMLRLKAVVAAKTVIIITHHAQLGRWADCTLTMHK